MATSSVDICNFALNRIGVSRLISALDEDTPEAEACALWYEQKRDALLRRARWSWAMRRAALAELVSHDASFDDVWLYVYSMPADCLLPLEIWSGVSQPTAAERVVWAPEWDGTSGKTVICTNQDDAILLYVAQITTVARFPAEWAEALAWSIAAEIALPLLKDANAALRAGQQAELAFQRALAMDANTGQPEAEAVSPFITSRW